IGVSEIRKSAGHFSVSFTQRTSAVYFPGVNSALKAARSCGSTVTIRYGLLAVRLRVDDAVDMEGAKDCSCILVGEHNHAMATWRNLGRIDCGYGVLMPVRRSDDKSHEWHAL